MSTTDRTSGTRRPRASGIAAWVVFVLFVAAACSACGGCKDRRVAEAGLTTTQDTQCWSADRWKSCNGGSAGVQKCEETSDCCGIEKLACAKRECGVGADGKGICKYTADTEHGCACLPGACSPDQTKVCSCTLDENKKIVASNWQSCPSDHPRCDETFRRCVCNKDTAYCSADKKQLTRCIDGQLKTETCTASPGSPTPSLCVPGVGDKGAKCSECSPMSSRSCSCPAGDCPGRSTCDTTGKWGPCRCSAPSCLNGWQRGNIQGQPDPHGAYCIFSRTDPGGNIQIPVGKPPGTVLLTSTRPPECQATTACAVRAVFATTATCDSPGNLSNAAVTFRCDGDPNTDLSRLLQYLPDPEDQMKGPQFICQNKLELLEDVLGAGCTMHMEKIHWTGQQLGLCPL